MFEALGDLIAFIGGIGDSKAASRDASDQKSRSLDTSSDRVRLAIAALLVHVATVDGVLLDSENDALAKLLSDRFGLGRIAALSLMSSARKADSEANDFSGFAAELKRRLDIGERRQVIDLMWSIARADGEVHEFEEALIARVAGVLDIDFRT